MKPRHSSLLSEAQKKIIQEAKTLIHRNRNELTQLMRAVYAAAKTGDDTTHFIDQLYFLNLAVVNIITKGNIKKFNPYLKEKIMEFLFSNNFFVKPPFSIALKNDLAALYLAFTEQRDNLSESLFPLIEIYSTDAIDASDHMMQSCNDRADLIKDFIQFSLNEPTFVSDQKSTKSHHEKVVTYLQDFYGPASLKRCLPKQLVSSEENTLASLIETYEEIFNRKKTPTFFTFFLSFKPLPSALELLNIMRKTILAYQIKYGELPDYLQQILWRINGLIPAEKQAHLTSRHSL